MSAEVQTKLLEGRIALVTGGASGIGRETCRVFAREGAKVAVVDINEAGINETLELLKPAECKGFVVDVSSSSAVDNMLADVRVHFSGVPSILVNSAGIARFATILEATDEQFDEVIGVNLKGTFLVTRGLCRLMVENKVNNGSIINISSIGAEIAPVDYCIYAASKGGVSSFTKPVAKEMGKYGIRVNAILPGCIETPMNTYMSEGDKVRTVSGAVLQRVGTPEEVAEACLFLASDRSSYISAASLKVTAGLWE